MADSNTVLRPLPRKPWQITPASTDPPSPSTPSEESAEQDKLSAPLSAANSRSILNLTSSTLFGIYSPQDADGVREAYSQGHTPWGTGTMTPSSPFSPTFIDDRKPPVIEAFEQPETRQRPSHRRPLVSGFLLPLTIRTIVLFISGLAYAVVITHLHDNRHLTPVKMEGLDGHSWKYFVSWGALSAVVGNIFPWLDFMFEGNEHLEAINQEKANGITSGAGKSGDVSDDSNDGVLRADWNPAVRGIGMFIGIAFAIVRDITHSCNGLLTLQTAKASMGIYITSFFDSCHDQSSFMVLGGPFKSRVHHIHGVGPSCNACPFYSQS